MGRVGRLPDQRQALCFVVRMRGVKFPEKFSINAFKMDPDVPKLASPLGKDH
jgi:hypothetical protein